MKASPGLLLKRLATVLGIVIGAVAMRLVLGVGFANYDTLYALVWGQQASRGQTPQYGIPIAPTPHPLVELLGLITSPLGPKTMEEIAVALGFLALATCAWVIYRLGANFFGPAAGAIAAAIVITRVPILSYGVRAYIDVPYLLLVLAAVLVEARRPRAGLPVLALLAFAGLLRPEAWVFSGLYWLYLACWTRSRARGGTTTATGETTAAEPASSDHAPQRATGGSPRTTVDGGLSNRQLWWLAAVALSAPLLWIVSDLLVTGDPMWSLINTRATATTLDRVTGIANVPEYIPRRIGEILRPPVLLGAAIGGILSLWWLRERARLLALVGVIAVVIFAAFSSVGLPINTRYAFLPAAILALFCGAGISGWTLLPKGDVRRRWWMAAGIVVLAVNVAYAPSQKGGIESQMDALGIQQRIKDDLVSLVNEHRIVVRCEPVGVPNHAPIPLLALYLKTQPSEIVSAQVQEIHHGTYLDPATEEVQKDYILDPHDPAPLTATIPPGFTESSANRSWFVFERCDR